jgi:CheY-like chemotaxis protein
MARAHDLITADNWGPALFGALIESEASAYLSGADSRVRLVGPDARLQPQAFSSLALVIHELVTNSAKYGALSDRRGHVSVETRIDSAGNFIIDWRERNGPPVQAPKRRGFGSTVIERTVPFDLKGEARIDFELGGVHACFLIPATYVHRIDQPAPVSESPPSVAPERLTMPDDILIVEDTFIIALDLEDTLRKLGAQTIRTASSVAQALATIEQQAPRFALLDVNLGVETSFEIATRLIALGVPFAFMTGYGENAPFPPELAHVQRVRKPFTQQSLVAALRGQRR